jgi:signal transduction histidine kinase
MRAELTERVLAAIDQVRHRADAKGLALEVELPEGPIYVNADPGRLSQILDNLLSNAVNYTERGSITISVAIGDAETEVPIRDRLGFACFGIEAPTSTWWQIASLQHWASRLKVVASVAKCLLGERSPVASV